MSRPTPTVEQVAQRRRRRLVVGVAASFAVMFVGVVVLPTREWFAQQRSLADARTELRNLTRANDELVGRVGELGDDAAVERRARTELGLVKPGEESYVVTEPRPLVVNLPPVWPFGLLQDSLTQAAQRQRDPSR